MITMDREPALFFRRVLSPFASKASTSRANAWPRGGARRFSLASRRKRGWRRITCPSCTGKVSSDGRIDVRFGYGVSTYATATWTWTSASQKIKRGGEDFLVDVKRIRDNKQYLYQRGRGLQRDIERFNVSESNEH